MATTDELMKLTKAQLAERIIEAEKDAASEPDLAERRIIIQSPAGPYHILTGFVDDGAGDITITGLPESEIGHWAPFYELTVNGQELTLERITATGEAVDGQA